MNETATVTSPAPHRCRRLLWAAVWHLLFRPSPRPWHGWRRLLLRCFGAHIGRGAHPYPSVRIWAPWHLSMGAHSCLGDRVDCYSVDRISLGTHATVSQDTVLCTATHDYETDGLPLRTAPIVIHDYAWVTAGAFVHPGVEIGSGAVVGARAVVTTSVTEWCVVAGHPATVIKQRQWRPALDGSG